MALNLRKMCVHAYVGCVCGWVGVGVGASVKVCESEKQQAGRKGKKRSGVGSVEVEALDFNFSTWHIHWAEVRVCVPDPKLAKIVVAPALHSTSA